MTKEEALKLALEALEHCITTCFDKYSYEEVVRRPEHFVNQTITAIKEALAQPAQEPDRQALQANGTHPAPCARHCEATAFNIVIRNLKAQLAQPAQEPVAWEQFYPDMGKPQRPWAGLTDEERKEIMRYEKDFWGVSGWEWKCMEALEAKLKDKNA